MPQYGAPYELPPVDLYKTTRGAADVHHQIATYLSGALPPFINQARIDWDRTEYELPYPKLYKSYLPIQIEAYPAITTVVSRDNTWENVDKDAAMGLQYMPEYDVKLYIWIESPQNEYGWLQPMYEKTLELRDDMLTLVRAALLIDPSLGSDNDSFKVKEQDMFAEYLEIMPAGEERPDYLTASSLTFTVQARQTVARKTVGVVEYTSVEVDRLPAEVIEGHVP